MGKHTDYLSLVRWPTKAAKVPQAPGSYLARIPRGASHVPCRTHHDARGLGQLAVFPNATHMIIVDDPVTLSGTVERFFTTPFTSPRDRVADMMASYAKRLAALPK